MTYLLSWVSNRARYTNYIALAIAPFIAISGYSESPIRSVRSHRNRVAAEASLASLQFESSDEDNEETDRHPPFLVYVVNYCDIEQIYIYIYIHVYIYILIHMYIWVYIYVCV